MQKTEADFKMFKSQAEIIVLQIMRDVSAVMAKGVL